MLTLVFSSLSSRLQKKLGNIDDKSSMNSSVTDDLTTKRQKLEAGYSSKVDWDLFSMVSFYQFDNVVCSVFACNTYLNPRGV